ncbi:ADP-ribosylation factor-binding protein GGA3 isoform X2 [Sceloporus undulatus]|nr:ADP-ribosylation factor-binding protein GGA3 isoform X2 [Sceloporus undulatus]XP_042306217.1 ADP-ribosylation factor-binding protein GGA3 isoform X2 [Sceloporus undulatus]XP_042306218.1 ADP-ribosylation factor-binding protein GGA3 isoform X2 [Sceloporus undulatus]XP_042306219.1 ADP-ribosylation factor-binding protein GGA3 isoform X2 [Sceloporus undulatus]
MKNCGRRFHNEVGKFRFLNELIKVVSPKYLGDRVSEKVKTKIIELLYSWTVALPDESKIKDAYYMLKRQGIVLSDPVIPVERTLIPSPPPRPKNPVFDDEEKSKLLAKLLKSKNPDDLQEANKLIKSMVKEDEARIQKVTKRMHTLEEVNNNVKLLNEMLVHYSKEDSSEADKELMKELYDRCETKRRTLFKLASETEDNDSSLGDILQASDNLSRVINSYKRIIEGQVINGEVDISILPTTDRSDTTNNINTLIDLAGLDISSTTPPPPPPPMPPATLMPAPTLTPAPASSEIPILPPPPQTLGHSRSRSSSQAEATSTQVASRANSLSLLDEELLCLGLNDPAPTAAKESAENNQWNLFQNEPVELDFLNPKPVSVACNSATNPLLPTVSQPMCGTSAPLASTFTAPPPVSSIPAPTSAPFMFSAGPPLGLPNTVPAASGYIGCALGSNGLHKMNPLGHLLDESKGTSAHGNIGGSVFHPGVALPAATSASLATAAGLPITTSGITAIPYPSSCTPRSGSPLFQPASFQQQGSPLKGPEISLASVHVPLESIKPSSAVPVTAYDKDGLRILLHFAKDCPPGRPDVLVVVVSMLNTAPLPIKNIVLQAAVPKSMKVKLQPPSGTALTPFNPIQPPAAITQVMLLANPRKEKVRLRYRLTFTLGDQHCTEAGEIDQFPPTEQWGNL